MNSSFTDFDVCLSGRPVPMGTEGKLRASWIANTKKLSFKDDSGRFDLLPLKV